VDALLIVKNEVAEYIYPLSVISLETPVNKGFYLTFIFDVQHKYNFLNLFLLNIFFLYKSKHFEAVGLYAFLFFIPVSSSDFLNRLLS